MDAPFGLMYGGFEFMDDYFGLIERKDLLNNTLFHFCGQIQSVPDSIVDGEIGEKIQNAHHQCGVPGSLQKQEPEKGL